MLDKLLESQSFVELMKIHVGETIDLLFEEEQEFMVFVNRAKVDFEPPLPEHIVQSFRPIMPFIISNYSYKSARLDEFCLSFEAGFGEENFGSVVTIDLTGIVQIVVEDTPILVNLSVSNEEKTKFQSMQKEDASSSVDKSMKAFLSNPKNEKLLR